MISDSIVLRLKPLSVSFTYFRVSFLESLDRDRKLADLAEADPPPFPSPSFSHLESSSSMVISTLPGPAPWGESPPPVPALSACLNALGWAVCLGSSSLLPVSYFLSLRDSCFFFSEAAAFSLDGSPMERVGPCGEEEGTGEERSHFRRKGGV